MFQFLKTQGQKIKNALGKTRSAFSDRLRAIFSKPLDENTLEELEQILYSADLGSCIIEELLEYIKGAAKREPNPSKDFFMQTCFDFCRKLLPPTPLEPKFAKAEPTITIVLGTNGTGKTTTLAKLAHHYQKQGQKVLLAAGDTFRAAAPEQLMSWAAYLGVKTITGQHQSDPAAVLFDAIHHAREHDHDIILCDTAGRIDSQTDFLLQLEKLNRVVKKADPTAPHNVLFMVDATMGQNVVEQVQAFGKYIPITGLIITKLDGSSKGGILISLYKQLQIPIYFVGTGEKLDDFAPFDPTTYLESIFEI